jgi:hypothetical protein
MSSLFSLCRPLLGKGGPVAGRVHPRIKQILRGVKQESNLRHEAITRFNKRWRSWAIRMVRKQTMPRQVVLGTDPELMDAEYLATCIHQAGCKGVKDVDLWRGFVKRLPAVIEDMTPEHFGFVCWAVGKVQVPRKSNQPNQVHEILIQKAINDLSDLTSHGMMAILWTLKRALVAPPPELLEGIANRILESPSLIRPSDYISICNSLGFFGYKKSDKQFRDKISSVSLSKFESETFAQDFRAVIHPLAMVNLWNDNMNAYILERFRRVFITARPNHLLSAYYASVSMRVLAPSVWFDLTTEKTRGFYTRLAVRHITAPSRGMCKFHKSVSDVLAASPFSSPHRNMFRWGPFWIDIGIDIEEDVHDRKRCVLLDKQSCFLTNGEYTQKTKLEHELLSQLGWKVGRINQREWKKAGESKREELVRKALNQDSSSIGVN